MFVFVIDRNNNPLMPTKPSRARRWIRDGKATGFWKRGFFCVRLNCEPSERNVSRVAIGIDPGAKKEGITVKSRAHTYLNLQLDAVMWVKDAIKTRHEMRRNRRSRKTPCRKNRKNRKIGGIPPSVRARWHWKLRVVRFLSKLVPISDFVVEDIRANSRRQRKWDVMFSPIQVGKRWFYNELIKMGTCHLLTGWDTKGLRERYGLKKISNKKAERFEAHCVDSWCLANCVADGKTEPDNKEIMCLVPLRYYRRQLHCMQPGKGGIRKRVGSTMSHGFKRGSLIKHPKWGLSYVGGYQKDRITLRGITTGRIKTRKAKPSECKFLSYNSWRWHPPH